MILSAVGTKLTGKSIVDVLHTIAENHKITEEQQTRRHEISAIKDATIEAIKNEREIIEKLLNKEFDLKNSKIDELFVRLDQAIESNNIEIVQSVLATIVSLAKDNPLAKAVEFASLAKQKNRGRITL